MDLAIIAKSICFWIHSCEGGCNQDDPGQTGLSFKIFFTDALPSSSKILIKAGTFANPASIAPARLVNTPGTGGMPMYAEKSTVRPPMR